LGELHFGWFNDIFLEFKAICQYFCKFATVDKILEVVLLWAKEAGSKDHTKIVAIHLVKLLLPDDKMGEKGGQQDEDLVIDVFHVINQRADKGYLIAS
jgi:hypothetical protein